MKAEERINQNVVLTTPNRERYNFGGLLILLDNLIARESRTFDDNLFLNENNNKRIME